MPQVGVPERVAKIMTFPEMVRWGWGEEIMNVTVYAPREDREQRLAVASGLQRNGVY